ncbi:APC family permease [Natrinema sp. DC36]|uniref:APC family permease n=1 Tax=Natrinema sp. DC36 TaxID=2878680 RepID=UPI001CF02C3D|nr:APC family permease [Natrinema sp. DC36]
MSQIEETKIGFLASVAAAIGISIGGGVWVTPVVAGSMAGPTIILLGVLAAIPIFLSFPAYFTLIKGWPTSAGHYFYPSRLLLPENKSVGQLIGWLAVWMMTSLGAVAIIQYILIPGAEIIHSVAPIVSTHSLVLLLITFSFTVVWFGLRMIGWIEIVLSALLLISIAAVVLPGFGAVNPDNLSPLTPPSVGGAVAAFALLYSIAAASFYTVDFGGGVKDAEERVTQSITIAATANITIAILIGVVSVGIVSYTQLSNETLAFVALQYLPSELLVVVGFGAVLAGVTSNIVFIMIMNRYVKATASDGLIPDIFGKTNKYGEPMNFLVLLYVITIATTFLNIPLSVLATCLTLAFLTTFSIGPLIGIRLPSQFPDFFEKDALQSSRYLTPTLVRYTSIGAIGINTVSFAFVSFQTPLAFAVYLGLITIGTVLYGIRRKQADITPDPSAVPTAD